MTPEELKDIKAIDEYELHRHEVFSGLYTSRYSQDKESSFTILDSAKTRRAQPHSYARSGVSDTINSWEMDLDNTEKDYYE